MGTFLQDLRFAARMLLRNPGFTAVAVVSLALGIGANSTIFTLVNAVLLRPLPMADSDRLVALFTTDERNRGSFFNYMQTSRLNFEDYRRGNDVFTGMVCPQRPAARLLRQGRAGADLRRDGDGRFLQRAGGDACPGARLPSGRGPRARREPGDGAVVRILAAAARRRPRGRRPRDHAQRPRLQRGRDRPRGLQGNERDRRAGPVGADDDTPAARHGIPQGEHGVAAGARLRGHGPFEAGRHARPGRSPAPGDRRPARARVPRRQRRAAASRSCPWPRPRSTPASARTW